MFLRGRIRRKDGKQHRYWSIVENRRVSGGRTVQRHVLLYLGEINDAQKAAWCRTIEAIDEGGEQARQIALFPEDRLAPALNCDVVHVRLSGLRLHRPRQWGACWLACHVWALATTSSEGGIPGRIVADAYYAARKIVTGLLEENNHLVTRVKSNAVAYTAHQQRSPRKRGRPRVYGRKVKLSSLDMSTRPTSAVLMCAASYFRASTSAVNGTVRFRLLFASNGNSPYRPRSAPRLRPVRTRQRPGRPRSGRPARSGGGRSPELARIPVDQLKKDLRNLIAESPETEAPTADGGAGSAGGPAIASATPALDQFTQNLTERAKKGELDAVVGRDNEIRQVIDILTRRRQNNPILTGEAGVGKTAVVEGLALRIAAGDVPEPLRKVVLRMLDLGLLQAGAGVKGEFENRLKSVIQEVKSSPVPVILFIDEAHTMIGAGGQAGQGDAANLLKPALARGELRTIAATTFKEYKQYFEKDAALERRFQVVRVEEPDETKAGRMLRGLVPMLEKHHKVRILDEAVSEAVRLSHRYVPERQLPDKAVSLLDTACARVRLSQSATPPALEDCTREIEHLTVELAAVDRETVLGADHNQRVAELTERKKTAEARRAVLEKQVVAECKLVEQIQKLQTTLEESAKPTKDPKPKLTGNEVAELTRLREELSEIQGNTPLVYPVADGDAVATRARQAPDRPQVQRARPRPGQRRG